ncbi:hypothetical protein [Aureliella helgolandensis]|uniref:Uncharacterized protein n=1 Tax=Aureliella helgolandensis TaxID=2527968 RepID=A0A518G451_9BACT|nr:hypothetical protein [Aureliella helgolandensis]QDV23371.1 hypothetical protein Q31a_16690 [Aureliella helgolandensis]
MTSRHLGNQAGSIPTYQSFDARWEFAHSSGETLGNIRSAFMLEFWSKQESHEGLLSA